MPNTKPVTYLSRSDFAKRIGVQTSTLARYKLPKPDAIIGVNQRPTYGWLPQTIDTWNTNRPGRGNWKKD